MIPLPAALLGKKLLGLLFPNWQAIAIAILAGTTLFCWKQWRSEARDFAVFVAQAEEAGRAAERKKQETEAEHRRITKEMSDAWSQNLNAYRADAYRIYSERLRNNAGGGAMRGLALRPAAPDGPGTQRLAACQPDEAFIQDAAEDAARVREWQDWAKRIGFPVK